MENLTINPDGLKVQDFVVVERSVWGEEVEELCYIFSLGKTAGGNLSIHICGYGTDLSVHFDSFKGIRRATNDEIREKKRIYVAKDFIGKVALYEGTKAVSVTDLGDGYVNAVFLNSANYTNLPYNSVSLSKFVVQPLVEHQLKYIQEQIEKCTEGLNLWNLKKEVFLKESQILQGSKNG